MPYIITWQFEPKHTRYWADWASKYGTNKKSARVFPSLTQATAEAQKIMDYYAAQGRHVGASPRRA